MTVFEELQRRAAEKRPVVALTAAGGEDDLSLRRAPRRGRVRAATSRAPATPSPAADRKAEAAGGGFPGAAGRRSNWLSLHNFRNAENGVPCKLLSLAEECSADNACIVAEFSDNDLCILR